MIGGTGPDSNRSGLGSALAADPVPARAPRAVVPPRNPRLCRFQKYVSAARVDRALALAERMDRRRLVTDEVDRAAA